MGGKEGCKGQILWEYFVNKSWLSWVRSFLTFVHYSILMFLWKNYLVNPHKNIDSNQINGAENDEAI